MLSQVASQHGGSAPTVLSVLKALPSPSWTLWGGGAMEMKGHLWGPIASQCQEKGLIPSPCQLPVHRVLGTVVWPSSDTRKGTLGWGTFGL